MAYNLDERDTINKLASPSVQRRTSHRSAQNEVQFINFYQQLPCVAASNTNGSIVTVMMFRDAALIAHIAALLFADYSSNSNWILHVGRQIGQMINRYRVHKPYSKGGKYAVVTQAMLDGENVLEVHVNHVIGLLEPLMEVRLVKYDVRAYAASASVYNETVFIDALGPKMPVVWEGDEIVNTLIASK